MAFTQNRNYRYPVPGDAALVPADMQVALDAVDADMQALLDRIEARETVIATHAGDGTWALSDGLASPVAVSDLGDGLYSIGA